MQAQLTTDPHDKEPFHKKQPVAISGGKDEKRKTEDSGRFSFGRLEGDFDLQRALTADMNYALETRPALLELQELGALCSDKYRFKPRSNKPQVANGF